MATIGCAGILVADTFCGPLAELPREGQLVALESMPAKAGGCAANVALDLARQGLTVEVAGCLGRDPAAQILLSCFAEQGVGCRHLVYSDHAPTSKTVILLVAGQDRRYLHVFGANAEFTIAHLDREWVAGLDAFYLGGLFAMPGIVLDELGDLLRLCRNRGVKTIVDVVIPQQAAGLAHLPRWLPYVDYFVPNDDEARLLTGQATPRDQLRALLAGGARTVIITRGRAGALAGRADQCWECGTYAVEALDPSGSGDAFAAGVITGLVRGWALPELLRYASALGASATRAVGTTDGVFTAAEAAAFVAAHPLPITVSSL